MRKDILQPQLGLINRVKALNPELAACWILRSYTWPTAVLTRVAVFMEIGAGMNDALGHAVKQMTKPPPKNAMLDFVLEQKRGTEELSELDAYHRLMLPKTGIHVVNLADPFTWSGALAQQKIAFMGDLARHVAESGPQTVTIFGNLIDAQIDHFSRCIKQTNQFFRRREG